MGVFDDMNAGNSAPRGTSSDRGRVSFDVPHRPAYRADATRDSYDPYNYDDIFTAERTDAGEEYIPRFIYNAPPAYAPPVYTAPVHAEPQYEPYEPLISYTGTGVNDTTWADDDPEYDDIISDTRRAHIHVFSSPMDSYGELDDGVADDGGDITDGEPLIYDDILYGTEADKLTYGTDYELDDAEHLTYGTDYELDGAEHITYGYELEDEAHHLDYASYDDSLFFEDESIREYETDNAEVYDGSIFEAADRELEREELIRHATSPDGYYDDGIPYDDGYDEYMDDDGDEVPVAHGRVADYDPAIEHDLFADDVYGGEDIVLEDISAGEEQLYSSYLDDDILTDYDESLGLRAADFMGEDTSEEDFIEGSMLFGDDGLPPETYTYDRHALDILIRETGARVAKIKKEIKKNEKINTGGEVLRDIELSSDKLNRLRSIVELRVAVFAVVCRGGFRHYVRRTKAALLSAIAEYNAAAAEYEDLTGYTIVYASRAMVEDVIAGRPYQQLSAVRFVTDDGFQPSAYTGGRMTRGDKRAYHREQLRILREHDREQRKMKKLSRTGRRITPPQREIELGEASEKIERTMVMLEARIRGQIEAYEKKRDMTEYTFSVKYEDKRSIIRDCNTEIKRLSSKRKLALRAERYDSERYYAALLITPDAAALENRAKRDKLESMNMRLETLLLERERIDEQLIKLYTGGVESKRNPNRDIVKVRRRAARKYKRYFLRDMRILDAKIPRDVKEKIVKCCNKIISTETEIAELKYRIRHQRLKGPVLYDAKGRIRDNKRALKRYHEDYKHFLKKGKKYVRKLKANKEQILWILGTLAVVAIGAAIYLFIKYRLR